MTAEGTHLPSGGVPCSGCGYDLRGLPREGKCPECGTPVERSLAGNRLIDADPAWLVRIARGARFLASAMLLLCCGTAGIFALMLMSFGFNQIESVMQAPLLDIGMTTYFLASLLLMTISAFLLTSQEPRDVERESVWSLRHGAQWGLLASVPLLALATGLGRMGPNRGVWIATALTARILLAVTLTVAIHSLLCLLAAFARRAPTPKLAASTQRSARFMAWALPVLFLAMFVHSRPAATGMASWLDALLSVYQGLLGCAGAIVMVGMVAEVIKLCVLMRCHARLLRAASERAVRRASRRFRGANESA